MSTRICPKCAAENPDGASFCSFCRADLGSATSTETGVVAAAPVTGSGSAAQTAPESAPESAQQPAPQPAPIPQPASQPASATPTATVVQPSAAAQPQWQPAPSPQQGIPTFQTPQSVPAAQYASSEPTAKKKSPVKIIILIVVGLLLLCGIGVGVITCTAFSAVNAVADNDYYEIGGEKIPSVKLALGEKRTVTNVASETTNGLDKQTIVYSVSTNQAADMNKYFDFLQQQGFITTKDYDFSKPSAEGYQVARNSADSGKVVVVTINYNSSGYDVTLDKVTGSVTSNDLSTNSSATNTPAVNNSSTNTSSDSSMAVPYLQIFESNNFHAAYTIHASSDGTYQDDDGDIINATTNSDIEIWVKGQQTATHISGFDMTIRVIVKDGKAYTIMDDLKMMQVSAASNEYDFASDLISSDLTYNGTGTDTFLNQQLKYEEYQSSDGSEFRYYFNTSTGNMIGIQILSADGTTIDMEFTVLDKNVPDSVFDIPADYTIINE